MDLQVGSGIEHLTVLIAYQIALPLVFKEKEKAGQCLAEVHALGEQGRVDITQCSHFSFTSEV